MKQKDLSTLEVRESDGSYIASLENFLAVEIYTTFTNITSRGILHLLLMIFTKYGADLDVRELRIYDQDKFNCVLVNIKAEDDQSDEPKIIPMLIERTFFLNTTLFKIPRR